MGGKASASGYTLAMTSGGTRVSWDGKALDTLVSKLARNGYADFVIWRDAEWSWRERKYTRGFVLDLSYYESFNDEHFYGDDGTIDLSGPPACLCEDNAEDHQAVW